MVLVMWWPLLTVLYFMTERCFCLNGWKKCFLVLHRKPNCQALATFSVSWKHCRLLPVTSVLWPLPALSQAGALEAALEPEDHCGGAALHQQPQRVVTLRGPAAASQRHEQHLKPWSEAWAGIQGARQPRLRPERFSWHCSQNWVKYVAVW